MTDPALKVDLGGNVFIIPSTARRIKLYFKLVQNTWTTLELDAVDYIVPTGKKLWILYIETNGQSADAITTMKKHTVVDLNAGTLINTLHAAATGKQTYPEFISVEAGKYINCVQDQPASQDTWVHCVELDA